jgi:hypothetical protein
MEGAARKEARMRWRLAAECATYARCVSSSVSDWRCYYLDAHMSAAMRCADGSMREVECRCLVAPLCVEPLRDGRLPYGDLLRREPIRDFSLRALLAVAAVTYISLLRDGVVSSQCAGRRLLRLRRAEHATTGADDVLALPAHAEESATSGAMQETGSVRRASRIGARRPSPLHIRVAHVHVRCRPYQTIATIGPDAKNDARPAKNGLPRCSSVEAGTGR